MGGRRTHGIGSAVATLEPVLRPPALQQRPHVDARHCARLLQPGAGAMGEVDLAGQAAAIFHVDHSSPPLWKIASTFFDTPRAHTAYRKITTRRYDIEWTQDEAAIAYDQKSDGMYPLLSNDRSLSPVQVLEAHKRQPTIEKRFEQVKSVHDIAPVFLKNEGRIEALFTVYFLALLVQALIERELRHAMQRAALKDLPLYPEHRACKHPTTEQVLRLFSLAEQHTLHDGARTIQVFHPRLTDLQRKVLSLLGIPESAFRKA